MHIFLADTDSTSACRRCEEHSPEDGGASEGRGAGGAGGASGVSEVGGGIGDARSDVKRKRQSVTPTLPVFYSAVSKLYYGAEPCVTAINFDMTKVGKP